MSSEVLDFEKEVIEKSHQIPVLVDFWAEWCGPCKVLGPVLEKLSKESNGNWVLAKVDTDKDQELAIKFGIRGIPNCKLFSKGKVVNEFTGALPEQAVREWLKKSIPSKYADSIDKAKELLHDGNNKDAKHILEKILRGESGNIEAKILLAKALLFEEPKEAISLIQNDDNSLEYRELADSIQTIAELLQKKEKLPDSEVFDEYSKAIEDLKNKNFDGSLEKFIDVIRRDRIYDDDGSRKACIAIFKYLGEDHPITTKYRREFGSALYV